MGPNLSLTAHAAGAPAPRLVHIPSDDLAIYSPDWTGSLLGDKMHSAVFDNSKIKRLSPEFICTTSFAEGIAQSVRWLDAEPARQTVDHQAERRWDLILEGHQAGVARTLASLSSLPH